MLLCMRTTIDIQDDLLIELKRLAAESNRTLKDLVEDAIRAALALRRSEVTRRSTSGAHHVQGKRRPARREPGQHERPARHHGWRSMILCDVNVLIYAHREECDRHDEYKAWLEALMRGGSAYGVSDLVLSGCLRILTHPRIFDPPSPAPNGDGVRPPGAGRHPRGGDCPGAPTVEHLPGALRKDAMRGETLSRTRTSPRSPLNREVNGSARTGTMRASPAFAGVIRWKSDPEPSLVSSWGLAPSASSPRSIRFACARFPATAGCPSSGC